MLTVFLIPNLRAEHQRGLDWTGFLLVGLACLLLVYGLSMIGSDTQSFMLPALLVAAAVMFALLAIRHSARHPSPLLEFSAFRIPTFFVSNWGGPLQRAAISTVPFLAPLMFRVGFGLDPFSSGLLLLILFAGNLCMKPATTGILRRFGFKRVLIGNGLILAASLAACALLWPSTPPPLVAIVLFIGGMSRSMQFTALNTIAFADVPQSRMASANVLTTLLQQLAMGTGIAVGAVALRISALVLGTRQQLPTTADFHGAFLFVAGLTILGIFDSLGLATDAGNAVSGHRRR